MIEWKRLENESDEELIYRICSAKEQIGTWEDVADVLNELLNTEYTSSKFRKQFQAFEKMLKANENKFFTEDGYLKELQRERQELQKEKQKLSDERVELNRIIREEARKESYLDLVRRVICEETQPMVWEHNAQCDYAKTDNSLIVHLTDIHAGEEVDIYSNKFNADILKQRIEDYTDKVINIAKLHHSEKCYLIIGEVVSGIIHNNLRLQNNMDMMESFKLISELISSMVAVLSDYFDEVYIYVTEGNHSRISANKEDSLKGENMDVLVPFYLAARLQNFTNVHIYDNDDPIEIARFDVYGNHIMAAHGDRDNPQTVVQNFTMMFGIKPDIVYLGHRHTNGLSTVFGSRVVESGSLIGTNNYAQDIRKVSKPEQTVSVVDKNGLVCLYDVTL